jgi:hypothetical protein
MREKIAQVSVSRAAYPPSLLDRCASASVASSRLGRPLIRACVFVLLAAIVVVPPLVRGTRHLADARSASGLSLNRGFDSPEAKCQVPAPVALRTRCSPKELGFAPLIRQTRLIAPDEAIPGTPSDAAPDALRGPPSLIIA